MLKLCPYILSFLLGLLFLFPATAEITVDKTQRDRDPQDPPSLLVRSKTDSEIQFSYVGAGVIRACPLAPDTTASWSFQNTGVLQFKVQAGTQEIKGVFPLETGKETILTIRGSVPLPMERKPRPTPAQGVSQPLEEGTFEFRNPYGSAFEQLSPAEQIKVVLESEKTSLLSDTERRLLLAFLYNQKAVQEANGNQIDSAIASLKLGLGYALDQSFLIRNLAHTLAVSANTLRQSGNLKSAEAQFHESLTLLQQVNDPELETMVRSGLSATLVDTARSLAPSEIRRKTNLLEQALDEDPQNAAALFHLGELAYSQYDLETALDLYTQAYAISQEPKLLTLMEKLQSEITHAGDFVTKDTGTFRISFEGREVQFLEREIRRLLTDALREIGRKLGLRPSGSINVVLYSGGQFQQVFGLHSWVGGAYDGKIRLPLSDLDEPTLQQVRPQIRELVAHELTHALIHNRAGQTKIPAWFHEGIAQHLSGEKTDPTLSSPIVKSAVQNGTLPKPSDGWETFVNNSDPHVAGLLYFQAYDFFDYLIEKKGGWNRIRKVIAELADGKPFENAIVAAYKQTVGELEQAWLLAR